MAPDLGGWIHNFTVTETQTHKSGYTIYKITSIVFPRSVPQALTQIVVWRRFHDIKRLHRELKRRHKHLQLPGYMPEPIDCSFFKRFDNDVIQKRKDYILQLLDFAALHPPLFKCHAFAQFFNEYSSPTKLQKFVQKAVKGLNRNKDADDIHFKDTLIIKNDKQNVYLEKSTAATVCQVDSQVEEDEVEIEIKGSESSIKKPEEVIERHTHFLTPMASIESDDSDYIYEAALAFSQAVQSEANFEYNDAYTQYRLGVDILLNGCKDDCNEDRKFIAKAKIAKYLARADEIYERFLKHKHRNITISSANFQLAIDVTNSSNSESSALYLERPWNHMAKYKVKRLLGEKVLQVICITEGSKPSYVMKGIEKPSSNSPTQTVYLPQNIPYMVNLLAFFQSDQKIFLLLKLALGGKLTEHIHSENSRPPRTDTIMDNDPGDNENLEVNDLVSSSKQLLLSVSNTLEAVRDTEGTSKHASNECLREQNVRRWAEQLLVAIHSLHEKSVTLCDLHMDNLLLDENGRLLLTYFYQNEGISSDSCIHKGLSPTALENHFVAPERPLTPRSDWWSYGVILYELLVGSTFKSSHPGQIDLYGCVQYPENVHISECAQDLLEQLLQQAPELRIDCEQIKHHSFFENTNWEDVARKGCDFNGEPKVKSIK